MQPKQCDTESHAEGACCHAEAPTCDTTIATMRNRYFTGKYMTARDFSDEQHYFLSRRWGHNRLLHGWGVVHGLYVKHHPDPQCQGHVIVTAGTAVDACGRELILNTDRSVKLECARRQNGQGSQQPAVSAQKEPESFLLCMVYVEKGVEQVPALHGEGCYDPAHLEYNRIREDVAFKCVPLQDAGDGCWRFPGTHKLYRPHEDDDANPQNGKPPASTASACQECVPIALIEYGNGSLPVIDVHGRRRLRVAPDYLTHIVHANWTHGSNVKAACLKQGDQYRLEVTFDRTLLEKDALGKGTGVSEHTFIVQYQLAEGFLRPIEYLPPKQVLLDEAGRKAVFVIDECYLPQIRDHILHVTLKCDFIPDCHGEPVDGNFLRGAFPTGNGTPGGVFESWFKIVSDNGAGGGGQ